MENFHKQSVACYQEIVASNKIGPNIDQCKWKVDSLNQSEASYISNVAKMDYWERDEVFYNSFDKESFGFGSANTQHANRILGDPCASGNYPCRSGNFHFVKGRTEEDLSMLR